MAVNKVYPNAGSALGGLLRDDMVIMSGGFGLCGIPAALIEAIRESGMKGLTIVSNNAGIDDVGLGVLLKTRQVRKMISWYAARTPPSPSSIWRASWRSNSTRRGRWLSAFAPAARVFRASTPRQAPAHRSPRARRPSSSTAAPMCSNEAFVPTWRWSMPGRRTTRAT